MSQEVLFRNDHLPAPVGLPKEFDIEDFPASYLTDVPVSLELERHPISEFDRHQHLLHVAALDMLYARIDDTSLNAEFYASEGASDKQTWLIAQYAAISNLHALRSIYELRQGRNQEAVFFAGRTTEYVDRLRIFEAASEAGNSPVLMRLGNLRAEAEAENSLDKLLMFMMSEVTVGLNIADNCRSIAVLQRDKNIDQELQYSYKFRYRINYAIWKAIEGDDQQAYDILIKTVSENQKAEIVKLRDMFMATQIQATQRQGLPLSSVQKETQKILIASYYHGSKLATQTRKIRKPVAYSGGVFQFAQSILGTINYKQFADPETNLDYADVLKHYQGIPSNSAKYIGATVVGPSITKIVHEQRYRKDVESLGSNSKASLLASLMEDAQALALASTDNTAAQSGQYGNVTGQIEALRLSRKIQLDAPFVGLVEHSEFRTDYNRRLAELVKQTNNIGDIIVRFSVLCEILDVQSVHDTSEDSTYKDQFERISKIANRILANPTGLFNLESPEILQRCAALGVIVLSNNA